MNRQQRRRAARSVVKGRGGRKLVAKALRDVCDQCHEGNHEGCWDEVVTGRPCRCNQCHAPEQPKAQEAPAPRKRLRRLWAPKGEG